MSPRQEIVLGLSISLTGQFSRPGQQALNGLQLWEACVNAQAGIALGAQGRLPVRLIHYDDQSRVSRAQENVLRLLKEDRVDILLGPYSSALTMAVAPLAEEHRKLLWNHGGTSDEVFNRGLRYLVSTPSPASDYLRGLPPWLAQKSPPLRRITVVHSIRGTFAAQVARGVVEAAPLAGFYPVELLPMDSPDWDAAAVVEKLQALGPEVLVPAASFI